VPRIDQRTCPDNRFLGCDLKSGPCLRWTFLPENPVFTVGDGILWLHQNVECNSSVRKLQVLKIRGSNPMPGMHTFRISRKRHSQFSRLLKPHATFQSFAKSRRLETGIRGLDEMLNGGIPEGDSVLVAGTAGSGKTLFAQQFVTHGIQNGEPGVMVTFEAHPLQYQNRGEGFGLDLKKMVPADRVHRNVSECTKSCGREFGLTTVYSIWWTRGAS
jgi:KaiC protein